MNTAMAGSGEAHLRGASAILTVRNLVVNFDQGRRRKVHAVSDLSIDLLGGETLGVLGESGCGKSTLAKAIMQIPPPTSGSVEFEGAQLTDLRRKDLRARRASIQLIMQDPLASLNPLRKVHRLVGEGLSIWRDKAADPETAIQDALLAVGLDPLTVWDRKPHELSGGQCQRVSMARALVMNPKILICDEPVSSLDVSVQAQIINLLETTKESMGLSMVFIAHDVSVVKHISDRVMVMYLGKICEILPSVSLENMALHPYTKLLLESVPGATSSRSSSQGVPEPPSPLDPPTGCRFRTRCPLATTRCVQEEPQIREMAPGQFVACHHAEFSRGDMAPDRVETPRRVDEI